MANFLFLGILSLICLGRISADDSHGENAVNFNKESFDSSVENERLFVMFYAPWCGHCKRLAPTWDDLAKEINMDGRQVTIGKVDCTIETNLCSDHGVRGYPTVKFFNLNREGIKYTKQRTLDDLEAFIEEQLSEEPNVEGTPDDVELPEPSNGLYTLTDANFDAHIAKGLHFVKFYAPWCGHCKRLAPIWDDLAKAQASSDKVKISKVDCTQNSKVCSQHGVRGYPTLMWFTNGEKNEDYRGGRTIDDLSGFVTRMTGAQEEAKTSDDGRVPDAKQDSVAMATDGLYDLTDDNFHAHIAKGNHFIKFFAPWCGHCKRLAPTWEELGKAYDDGKTVKIGKVDCTQNSKVCSSFGVQGYPTLIWIVNGQKKGNYNRGRTLDDLKAFVEEQTGGDDAADDGEEGMVELDDDDFLASVEEDLTLVLFADGEKASRDVAETLEIVAQKFIDKIEVLIARVDCDKNSKTCVEQKALGPYPQIRLFRNGENMEAYKGETTVTAIASYLNGILRLFESQHDEL